ncbi:hypothetical protein GGQ62_002313 [Polymorphobacter fuscus]|nr:hypothetical protein [Polymorphobacter fuscus]NJC09315.1 hypothetical protein [Polymorphobacter fuscus]
MEFHSRNVAALQCVLPVSRPEGAAFLLLARLCARDWISADGRICPPAEPQPVSMSGIAASLGRPFETIRRHLRWLESAGVAVVDQRGAALAVTGDMTDHIASYLAAVHDTMLLYGTDLADADDMLPVKPGSVWAVPTVNVIERALDIVLVPFALQPMLLTNWCAGIVYLGIAYENIRTVKASPVLSRRYRYENTPDALREPVPLLVVATRFGLPYATVWRSAQLLRLLRVARPVARDGWLVATADLHEEQPKQARLAYRGYVARQFRALLAEGYDPAIARGKLLARAGA